MFKGEKRMNKQSKSVEAIKDFDDPFSHFKPYFRTMIQDRIDEKLSYLSEESDFYDKWASGYQHASKQEVKFLKELLEEFTEHRGGSE
jgi:hypothetical protein